MFPYNIRYERAETKNIYRQNLWSNFSVKLVLFVDIESLIAICLVESLKHLFQDIAFENMPGKYGPQISTMVILTLPQCYKSDIQL